MIFVLDAGNTHTVMGAFQEGKLIHEWRIKTDRHKTADEFGMLIHSFLDFKKLSFSHFSSVVISSVVPPIIDALEKVSKNYFQIDPIIVGRNYMNSYLKMRYPYPEEIGADRIVNAVAGIEEYGSPLIIIDFGTATTYCYINEKKEYVGGLIAPGIQISMEALYNKAAKLPKIEIQKPEQIVGQSTIQAMQSGVYYGYVGQVDGIIKNIVYQMETKPKVIATGGLADLLARESEMINIVDQNLTLKGLYFIYKKNKNTKSV